MRRDDVRGDPPGRHEDVEPVVRGDLVRVAHDLSGVLDHGVAAVESALRGQGADAGAASITAPAATGATTAISRAKGIKVFMDLPFMGLIMGLLYIVTP